MKKAFKQSMKEIQTELADHQLYRENYDFMMFSPMSTRLNQKISELISQNNDLQWANSQMRRQLLEYEELMTKLMKQNGKNGKSLRKLAKKLKHEPTPEEEHIEEYAILSEGDEITAPSNTPDVLSSPDNNVVDENISFELTEDISVAQYENVSDDTSHVRSLENELEEVDAEEQEEEAEEEDAEEEETEEEEAEEEETEEEEAEEEETEEEEAEEEETEEEEAEEEEAEEEEAEEEEAEEEAEEEEAEEEAEEEEAEEEAEEEEAEEETEEEEEEEAEEEEEEEAEAEEEEEEVYEVIINGKQYFTTNEKNGVIYAVDSDGEVGDEIGRYISGVATFK
jgi:hypothetical protein